VQSIARAFLMSDTFTGIVSGVCTGFSYVRYIYIPRECYRLLKTPDPVSRSFSVSRFPGNSTIQIRPCACANQEGYPDRCKVLHIHPSIHPSGRHPVFRSSWSSCSIHPYIHPSIHPVSGIRHPVYPYIHPSIRYPFCFGAACLPSAFCLLPAFCLPAFCLPIWKDRAGEIGRNRAKSGRSHPPRSLALISPLPLASRIFYIFPMGFF